MADATGSILGLSLDGQSFDVLADTDASITPARIKNEGIPTSGRTVRKMTKQVPTIKSCVIYANASETATLKAKAESQVLNQIQFRVADGSIWRGPGFIDFESLTTMDGKATLTLFPQTDWTLFAAP